MSDSAAVTRLKNLAVAVVKVPAGGCVAVVVVVSGCGERRWWVSVWGCEELWASACCVRVFECVDWCCVVCG